MIGALRYSAANAAVQYGRARILPEELWKRLLSASSLEAALSVLSTTAYRKVVEAPAELEAIERHLRSSLAHRYRIAIPFLCGSARDLVDWLWRPFELDNLIMVLRGVHNEMPASRIRSSLIPLGPACYLDWHVLSNSKSVSEVIDRLGDSFHGRFYARALKNAQSQYQRRQTVFLLEVALYIAYYRRLNQLLERLHGPDRKDGERFVGAMIDSQNVLWAYRYRIFFRFGPETVLSYTLPRGGRRVDATVIQRIATGAPLTELVGGLWNGELRGLRRIEDRPPREALVELEVVFRRHLYDLARNALTGYPFRLGMILAYGILLRAEVDDLIAVMEGLANGLSADRISSCLIRFQRTQS